MTVEEITKQIESEKKNIFNSLSKIDDYVLELTTKNAEDYDWISVKQASKLLDVSVNVIYNKIKENVFEVKLIGTKKFIRRSEIIKINDKVV